MNTLKKLIFKLPILSGIHAKLQEISRRECDINEREIKLNEREIKLNEREIALNNAATDVRNIRSLIRVFYEPAQSSSVAPPKDESERIPFSILSPPVLPADAREDEIAVVEEVEGHITVWEAEQLYSLARKCEGTILELGGFRGKSTVALLLGAQKRGNTVHSVDPLISSGNATGGSTIVDSEADYMAFQKNTGPWKEHLVFHRMKSQEVAWPGDPIELFFIDAFHTYAEVKADFHHFLPYLSENAVIAFHDYSPYKPGFPGVVKFVDELLDSGEWLWEDFRGALVTLKRVGSERDKKEIVQINTYLKNAHRKILEYFVKNESLEKELHKVQERVKGFEGSGVLLKGPFTHRGGNLWSAHIPQLSRFSDDDMVQASPLVLFENGEMMGAPHSLHEDIKNEGKGLYSHWNDTLFFSTSDNSNPNENNRQYWFLIKLGR